jgi:hypothetical protein
MQSTELSVYDYVVLVIYFLIVLGVGLSSTIFSFVATKYKQWRQRNTPEQQDQQPVNEQPPNVAQYFLAGRDMHWWAIGASLFSSNIGSEHFIGLAGTAAREGIAVCWFEWTGLFIILLLAYVFVPLYMESMIFTTPEFIGMFIAFTN